MSYLFERKINYYETDRMGVVHHSNYIRFLEEARCAYMLDMGLPYSKLEDLGIMIPVLGINCNYKTPVTFGDILKIKLDIEKCNGVRMSVKYTLTDINNNLVMIAKTEHCFTDKNLRPINIKKHFPDIFEKFSKYSLSL